MASRSELGSSLEESDTHERPELKLVPPDETMASQVPRGGDLFVVPEPEDLSPQRQQFDQDFAKYGRVFTNQPRVRRVNQHLSYAHFLLEGERTREEIHAAFPTFADNKRRHLQAQADLIVVAQDFGWRHTIEERDGQSFYQLIKPGQENIPARPAIEREVAVVSSEPVQVVEPIRLYEPTQPVPEVNARDGSVSTIDASSFDDLTPQAPTRGRRRTREVVDIASYGSQKRDGRSSSKPTSIDNLFGAESRMGRILSAVESASDQGISKEALCMAIDGGMGKATQVGIEVSQIRAKLKDLGYEISGGRGQPLVLKKTDK